ncbi:hypothetical protein [Desulfoluna spongiiphila]|uniref:hypothetical protein n=1 Tax=Desulfoluna spongiiphila TaxID=419481 RepID=UPI00125FF145|nr:hypothetical protein [Desulfoluna spongiiphila]
MGVFNRLFNKKSVNAVENEYFIDLIKFKCNNTALGEQPTLKEHFCESFDENGCFDDKFNGVELGLSHRSLDYVFVSLKTFNGKFFVNGTDLPIGIDSCEKDIIKLFGVPYWRDEDENEVILFYEDGHIELQFEFPKKATLAFITMMKSPILEDPEHRKSYKVTKPWPPNTKIQIQNFK